MADLFSYVSTINKKVGVYPIDNMDEFESVYSQYVVNLAFCRYPDTIMIIDDVLLMNNLTNLQHFDYLYNSITKKNRYTPWNKVEKNLEIELIQQIFNYSHDKAKAVLDLFTAEDIEKFKKLIYTGGKA